MEYDKIEDKHIARLVLGYLKVECKPAYKIFLKYYFKSEGKYIPTRIAGQTLVDILKTHSQLYEIVQGRLENTNYHKEFCSKLTPNYLLDQLLYLLDRSSYTPASTPCPRSPTESIQEQDNGLAHNHNSDVETTPEHTLPGNVQHHNENSYFHTPRRKTPNPKQSSTLSIEEIPVQEVSQLMTQKLLENHEFQEKLANTINTVLNTPEAVPKPTVEEKVKDGGVSAELDATIKSVLKKTEEDPIFENVLQEVLGSVPIVETINNALDSSISSSNAYQISSETNNKQKAYSVEQQNSEAVQNIIHVSNANASFKNTVSLSEPSPTTSSEIILFDGTFDKYVRSQSKPAVSQLATPVAPSLSTPLYVNPLGGLYMVPATTGKDLKTQYVAQPQCYFVNQPLVLPQNMVIPPNNQAVVIPHSASTMVAPKVNKPLTEEEIMAMPTVIVSDDRTCNTQPKPKKRVKTIVPKPKPEVASNIQDYLNMFNTDSSPLISQRSEPNKETHVLSTNTLANSKNEIKPVLCVRIDRVSDTPQNPTTITEDLSMSGLNQSNVIVDKEKTDDKVAKNPVAEQCNSQEQPKEGVPVTTTPPVVTNAKHPTPKSGSHVRTLDFSTPPKITSTGKKPSSLTTSQEKNNEKPNHHQKMQVSKTLFKSNALEAQIILEENEETKETTKKSRKSPQQNKKDSAVQWDHNLRVFACCNDEKTVITPKKKKKTPPKPKRKVRQIVKVQLNTTDQDGKAIEASLRTPMKTEEKIEQNTSKKILDSSAKKILSPSKLLVPKKTVVVQETSDIITPDMSREKTVHPMHGAKRNINYLLENTPLKQDETIPKTPGLNDTPGVTSTPFTPFLEANLRGITCGNFSVNTPDVPLTPGFSLSKDMAITPTPYSTRPTDYSTCSSYYVPSSDNEQNRSMEMILNEEKQRQTHTTECHINVISDVTVKPADDHKKKGLGDHLKAFNRNVIGKKNLSLMRKTCGSPDVSVGTSSDSELSYEGESNNTVICTTKSLSHSYVLRERKNSAIAQSPFKSKKIIGKGKGNNKQHEEAKNEKKNLIEIEMKKKRQELKATSKSKKGKKDNNKRKSQDKNEKNTKNDEIGKEEVQIRNENDNSDIKSDKTQETVFLEKKDDKIDVTSQKNPELIEKEDKKATNSVEETKKILSTTNVSSTLNYKTSVLKEMEEKRLRVINSFKNDKPVRQNRAKTNNVKKSDKVTDTQSNSTVTKSTKNRRKSDSPQKRIVKNETKDFFPVLSSDDEDSHKPIEEKPTEIEAQATVDGLKKFGINVFYNKGQKSKENIKKQNTEKITLNDNEKLQTNREENKIVTTEENTHKEKKSIETNVKTTPQLKSPTKPPESTKKAETPQQCCDSSDSEFSPLIQQFDQTLFKKEHKHYIYDENNVTSKKFEDYNLDRLHRNFDCKIDVEGGIKIAKVTCTEHIDVLDIPSEVNVLIPRRKRIQPVVNVARVVGKQENEKHKEKKKIDIATAEIKNKKQKTEKNEGKNDGTIENETTECNNKLLEKKEHELSEKLECNESEGNLLIRDAPPVKKSPENKPDDEDHVNYAILGNEREENQDETQQKPLKKRKHRSDSSSSNSLHPEKKSKNDPINYNMPKNVDIDSFLDKLYGK